MTFFKRKDIGRVYVIKMVLPDNTVVHKIGMCHSPRSVDRMFEILRSWFNSHRFVPYSELRLDLQTHNPAELEKFMHKMLESKRYEPEYKVEGHTEMFTGIDESKLLHVLRNFNISNFSMPLGLKDSDYEHLCELITL